MRLTFKLILALTIAIFVVLGLNAFVRLKREVALFENDIRKDDQLLGTALAGAVARIWETIGEAEALDLVEDADGREAHIVISWMWLDTHQPKSPLLTANALAQVIEGKTVTVKGVLDEEPGRFLFTYVPVPLPNGRLAAIELRESLRVEQQYLRKTIVQAIVTTGALVLLCAILASALGVIMVGRPVRRLVDQARSIGAGNLAQTDAPKGRDEVAELAREMNAMCERLHEARSSLEAETSRRLATQEQLRHADRLTTVGKLAAGIAHEVGTPLNVITGHAQLVKEEYAADSPAYENVVIIVEQANRVTAIIRQLLDFARQRTFPKSSHDLAAITRQVALLLAPLAQKTRLSLEVENADDAILAEVHAGQMQQVLTNLVVNGIQSMHSGGTIVIGTRLVRKRSPELSDSEERDYAAIYVKDTGAGIASNDLPRIFEPFFTTKDVGEGTGLGLSVAYGIVKEHGGWIDVSSVVREGTEFTVYLPSEQSHG